jgi:hypothetical protein
MISGAASFHDRFYKGRPIAFFTTRNSSGRTLVLIRIKNTTSYGIVVQNTSERRGVDFLAQTATTLNIIKGRLGKDGFPFILKPDKSKELIVMPNSRMVGQLKHWETCMWGSGFIGDAETQRGCHNFQCRCARTRRQFVN